MRNRLTKWIGAAVMGLGVVAAGAAPAMASPAHHPGGGQDHPRLVCHWEKIHRHHHVEWVRVCHWVRDH